MTDPDEKTAQPVNPARLRIFALLLGVVLLMSVAFWLVAKPSIFAAPTSTQTVLPTKTPRPTVTATLVEPVEVSWFIGVGTGLQAGQLRAEKKFVEKYNNMQGKKDGIILVPMLGSHYPADQLEKMVSVGDVPDIIGPVGTEGRGRFEDHILDLQPLIDKTGYDLSEFDPALLKFYTTDKGLVALPFAIYPSVLYYNKDLFDQAGLPYPPHKVGEKYGLDGAELDWSFETVAKIARRMTLDSKGVSADQKGFDLKKIVQWGFDFQWTKDSPRWFTAYFEPYYPIKDGKADLSPGQIAAIKWYYDGMWGKSPFIPTQVDMDGDLIKGNSFNSGRVAMGLAHLWYTCCITAPSDPKVTVPNWDVAVVPSYNGRITAKMHADTFSIMKDSKHPEAAFKVYSYLVGDGAAELHSIYGGLPVQKSKQAAFFENQAKIFAPNVVDWQVFIDMIPYLEVPGHELALPNLAEAHDGFLKFGSDLRNDPYLNIDQAITQFLVDETAIYNKAP